MWIQREAMLQDLLSEHLHLEAGAAQEEPRFYDLGQRFLGCYEDVARRNEAMLFRDLPPRARGSLSATLTDIKVH